MLDPAQLPAQVPVARPPTMFVHGLAGGVAICALLVQILLALLRGMADLYKDFGDGPLPPLTRLAISPIWRFGVPALETVAFALLVVRRPPRLVGHVVLAVASVATAVLTYYFAQAPIWNLAGNISG